MFTVALQCNRTVETVGQVDSVVSDIIRNKYVSLQASIMLLEAISVLLFLLVL